MTVMPFSVYTKRLLAVLQANATLHEDVKVWRRGELGTGARKDVHASAYPLIYVTTAPKPEVDRMMRGAAPDTSSVPLQERTYDLWAVVVVQGESAEAAQDKLYSMVHAVRRIMETNIQLRDPATNGDPLSLIAEVEISPRLGPNIGTPVESATVRMRISVAA